MLPHVSRAPRSSLFPYTTLFRSSAVGVSCGASGARSSVAKIPAARGHADAVVGSGDKSEALSDYGVRRGGGRSHGKLGAEDRKSTRLNSSHGSISYAVFCLKKKT